MNKIAELVTMKAKAGVDKKTFVAIIDRLERNFHSRQDGFLDTELLYDEKESTWVMIQHWQSLEQMKASSANMFRDDATVEFRECIDPKSVSIQPYPVLGYW